jgi:hypothetical protein
MKLNGKIKTKNQSGNAIGNVGLFGLGKQAGMRVFALYLSFVNIFSFFVFHY